MGLERRAVLVDVHCCARTVDDARSACEEHVGGALDEDPHHHVAVAVGELVHRRHELVRRVERHLRNPRMPGA